LDLGGGLRVLARRSATSGTLQDIVNRQRPTTFWSAEDTSLVNLVLYLVGAKTSGGITRRLSRPVRRWRSNQPCGRSATPEAQHPGWRREGYPAARQAKPRAGLARAEPPPSGAYFTPSSHMISLRSRVEHRTTATR